MAGLPGAVTWLTSVTLCFNELGQNLLVSPLSGASTGLARELG